MTKKELYLKEKTEAQRNSLVVKSNDLIRKARYNLTNSEQKILIYVISKIEAEDTDFKEVRFSLADYCRLAGFKINGEAYARIKRQIKKLADRSIWIDKGDQKEELFRWIDTAEINKGSSEVILKLHSSLKPYLLQLKENFTKYELIYILALNSKYAIKLFELLKSYLWQGKWVVEVNDLKEKLEIKDKYEEFKEFKRNVLTPSLKEINDYTSLNVDYSVLRNGRNISTIIFFIEENKDLELSIHKVKMLTGRLKWVMNF